MGETCLVEHAASLLDWSDRQITYGVEFMLRLRFFPVDSFADRIYNMHVCTIRHTMSK